MRLLHGMSQGDLANVAGIKQSQISELEKFDGRIQELALQRIAGHFKVPAKLFTHTGDLPSPSFLYRRKTTIPLKELQGFESRIRLITLLLKNAEQHMNFDASICLNQETSPKDAATRIRSRLGLKNGPVPNMAKIIEELGIILVELPNTPSWIDAVTIWVDSNTPVVFYSADFPGDRQRLNLAHELGHICLHQQTEKNIDEKESEAWAFADEFLMPISSVSNDLRDLDFRQALDLKVKWKISVAAIIMRAAKERLILERRKTSMFKTLSTLGMRKKEPIDIEQEDNPESIKLLETASEATMGFAAGLLDQLIKFNPKEDAA